MWEQKLNDKEAAKRAEDQKPSLPAGRPLKGAGDRSSPTQLVQQEPQHMAGQGRCVCVWGHGGRVVQVGSHASGAVSLLYEPDPSKH